MAERGNLDLFRSAFEERKRSVMIRKDAVVENNSVGENQETVVPKGRGAGISRGRVFQSGMSLGDSFLGGGRFFGGGCFLAGSVREPTSRFRLLLFADDKSSGTMERRSSDSSGSRCKHD